MIFKGGERVIYVNDTPLSNRRDSLVCTGELGTVVLTKEKGADNDIFSLVPVKFDNGITYLRVPSLSLRFEIIEDDVEADFSDFKALFNSFSSSLNDTD